MIVTEEEDGSWSVFSDSGKTYRVVDNGPEDAEHGGGIHCNCLAGQHGRSCKHIKAVMNTD